MILVGPGGATAIDVWATKAAWRFAVPPLAIHRRGGSEDDPTLPVGFLRWWFLAPVDGTLLTSVASEQGLRLILRSDDSIIDLVEREGESGRTMVASRRAPGLSDRVEFHGASFTPSPGDRATYDEEPSGVHVEVVVEDAADTPDPEAFVDPDRAR